MAASRLPATPWPSRDRRRSATLRLLAFVLVFAVLEALAGIVFAGVLSGRDFVWQDLDKLGMPPSQAELDHFRAGMWDPELGWVFRKHAQYETGREQSSWHTDARGARREVLELPGGMVSAYGDSFTFGAEVGDAETWPHYLSASLNTRVDNWGQTAWGPDQAVLRLRRNLPGERTAIVVLAVMSENIARVVNCYRPFLTRDPGPMAFKPMVITTAAGPRWLPNPLRRADKLADWFAAYQVARENDYWYRLNHERVRPRFPYLLRLPEALWYLWRHPAAANLYQDPNALACLDFVLDEFRRLAEAHDFVPVLLFIPQPADLLTFAQGKTTSYHAYLAALRSRAAGSRLVILDLVEHPFDPVRFNRRPFKEHPSPYGQAVIAAVVHEAISPLLPSTRGHPVATAAEKADAPRR